MTIPQGRSHSVLRSCEMGSMFYKMVRAPTSGPWHSPESCSNGNKWKQAAPLHGGAPGKDDLHNQHFHTGFRRPCDLHAIWTLSFCSGAALSSYLPLLFLLLARGSKRLREPLGDRLWWELIGAYKASTRATVPFRVSSKGIF